MASNSNGYNEVWDHSGAQTPTSPYDYADYPDYLESHTPGADMASSDGKRKKVGFSQDTTPPSFAAQPCSSAAEAPLQAEAIVSSEVVSSAETIIPSPERSYQPTASSSRQKSFQRNDISEVELAKGVHEAFGSKYTPKPKPAIRKTIHTPDAEPGKALRNVLSGEGTEALRSGMAAHSRAQKLAARVGSYNVSASPSGRNSEDLDEQDSPEASTTVTRQNTRPATGRDDDSPEEDALYMKPRERRHSAAKVEDLIEAKRLVRSYTQGPVKELDAQDLPLRSGQVTPVAEQTHAEDYVPKPVKYRGGVLASLLKLKSQQEEDAARLALMGRRRAHLRGLSTDSAATTPSNTPGHSPPGSGATTPRKHGMIPWSRHSGSGNNSPYGLGHLIASSSTLALPSKEFGEEFAEKGRSQQSRPGLGKRTKSSEAIASAIKRIGRPRIDEEAKIINHIAETIQRQKYLVKLCRALMQYGAPTHRLEGRSDS